MEEFVYPLLTILQSSEFAEVRFDIQDIHPKLHPYYRQSQVDFLNPDLDLLPNFNNAKAYPFVILNESITPLNLLKYSVDLAPGDVLYLPPFWFHHVTALDLSISVRILFTFYDMLLMLMLFIFCI
jgi:hypothetical protein